jgi:hypothetical protein
MRRIIPVSMQIGYLFLLLSGFIMNLFRQTFHCMSVVHETFVLEK